MNAAFIEIAPGFAGYATGFDADPRPGLILIQEIFGVNANMRSLADRFAAEGYAVLAPDLFWRLEPRVDLTDQSDADWQKAFSLYQRFDVAQGVKDIAIAIRFARARIGEGAKIGAVGYCLGGLMALLTATRTDIDAVASYYGVGMDQFDSEFAAITAPTLLHIAERDQYVPAKAREAILAAAAANPRVSAFVYADRDHAFAREGGAHWHAEDAQVANRRTAAHFVGALK